MPGCRGSTSATADPGLKRIVHDNLDRDRRCGDQLDPPRPRCRRRARRREARSLRAVCEAGRGHRVRTRRPAPDELTLDRALELLAAPKGDEPIGTDPTSLGFRSTRKQRTLRPLRAARRRRHAARRQKPKMASLFKTMTLETHHARRRAASCSRCPGSSASTRPTARSRRRTAATGRIVEKGKEYRAASTSRSGSSPSRSRRRSRVLAEPKRVPGHGARPSRRCASSATIRCRASRSWSKEGRFGPYVTDGETNASLRQRRHARGDHRRAGCRAAS